MTVTYTSKVATERLGGFFRLLFRWRGSIYSVIYREMSIFAVLYCFISLLYRHALNPNQKLIFEKLCLYFNQFSDYVPVTFVVGFYVVRIIARRWTQWENIPWPDRFAFDVSAYVQGNDNKSRMLRRTLVRYTNLAAILCFRDICMPVKLRFPTMDHMIGAGLMTEEEVDLYTKCSNAKFSNWWIPFQWCYTLVYKMGKEGKITENVTKLQDGVHELRQKCWVLFSHDWIQIPMVYTQVATLSVYMFMLGCLFGRQYVDNSKASTNSKIDLYIPFFTILQITFYLGWLKVGEVLICPMGLDADDFDVNYIIDRNMNIAYTIVDSNYNKLPPIEKDLHWNSGTETEIPHTLASLGVKDQPFKGSTVENTPEAAPVDQLVQIQDMPNGVTTGSLGGAAYASVSPSLTSLVGQRPQLTQRMVSRTGSTVLRSLVSVMARPRSHDGENQVDAFSKEQSPHSGKRLFVLPGEKLENIDTGDLATPLIPIDKSGGMGSSKSSQNHLLLASIAESSEETNQRIASVIQVAASNAQYLNKNIISVGIKPTEPAFSRAKDLPV